MRRCAYANSLSQAVILSPLQRLPPTAQLHFPQGAAPTPPQQPALFSCLLAACRLMLTLTLSRSASALLAEPPTYRPSPFFSRCSISHSPADDPACLPLAACCLRSLSPAVLLRPLQRHPPTAQLPSFQGAAPTPPQQPTLLVCRLLLSASCLHSISPAVLLRPLQRHSTTTQLHFPQGASTTAQQLTLLAC